MKKSYIKPEIEITAFSTEDIITASSTGGSTGGTSGMTMIPGSSPIDIGSLPSGGTITLP